MSAQLNKRGDVIKLLNQAALVLMHSYMVGADYSGSVPCLTVVHAVRAVTCEEVRQALYNGLPRESLHFKVQERSVSSNIYKGAVVVPDEFAFKSESKKGK